MKFVVWLLVCAVCVLAEESPPPQTSPEESPPLYGERGSRFINIKQLYDNSIETNEIIPEEKEEEEPSAALDGAYTECVLKFSLPCLQKKFLVFLDKLGRMDGFSLLGNFLSVKRTTKETMKPISEKVIDARMNSEEDLNSLLEFSIDRFFNTHKFHVTLPFGMTVLDDQPTGRSLRTGRNTLDIGFQDDGVTEGRTKKLIKKKIITLLVTMAKAKMAFLVPIAAILIKIKAVKALIFAKLALFLAIFSALKKAGVGAAGLGTLGLGGAGLSLGGIGAALGASGGTHQQVVGPSVQSVGTTYTQTGLNTASHTTGGSKIVIIHDPHHVGGGHGGHHVMHGHSHGHGTSTGYDGYGPSGGGGGGSWSSGGGGSSGDSYGPGGGYQDSGGWGRSWSPADPSNAHYRHNATAETEPST